jgi:hypothetical protein
MTPGQTNPACLTIRLCLSSVHCQVFELLLGSLLDDLTVPDLSLPSTICPFFVASPSVDLSPGGRDTGPLTCYSMSSTVKSKMPIIGFAPSRYSPDSIQHHDYTTTIRQLFYMANTWSA